MLIHPPYFIYYLYTIPEFIFSLYTHLLQYFWLVIQLLYQQISFTIWNLSAFCILCRSGLQPVHYNGMIKIFWDDFYVKSLKISHTLIGITLRLCSLVPQCCVWMSHGFEWGTMHRSAHNSCYTTLVFVPCNQII